MVRWSTCWQGPKRRSHYLPVKPSTWQWPRVILKNCLGFLTGKRCQIVLRCDWSRARAFCHRQGVQSTPYILGIAMAARSGAARRLGSQAGEYMAKHRGSKYQDPIQKENPVSTEPYGICWHPQRLRSSGWSGKTWGRAWNVRLWKGSLQAMYKMFRVLMVQSLLEEGTASPAQGLGSQGTEPPVLITVVANLVFRKNLPDEEDGRTRETGGGRESHPSGMEWDNWTRLEILESGNARLQEQAALAEENPQRVRSELHALRLMVQRLGQETSGPTMVAQTNMPGLRERIIREAQERGIEFSIRGELDEEGPEEPSYQDSDWYPGRDEDEGYEDRAHWLVSTGTSKSMNWSTNHWSILQTLRQQRYQPLRSKNYSLKKSQWEPGNS